MTKSTPEQHSKLANTYNLIYLNSQSHKKNTINISETANLVCLLKLIFND